MPAQVYPLNACPIPVSILTIHIKSTTHTWDLARCTGGVKWLCCGGACAFLGCLSGTAGVAFRIVRDSASGVSSVRPALWLIACQTLASAMLMCIYLTGYSVIFPLDNHSWFPFWHFLYHISLNYCMQCAIWSVIHFQSFYRFSYIFTPFFQSIF